jgi:hypothetical protein
VSISSHDLEPARALQRELVAQTLTDEEWDRAEQLCREVTGTGSLGSAQSASLLGPPGGGRLVIPAGPDHVAKVPWNAWGREENVREAAYFEAAPPEVAHLLVPCWLDDGLLVAERVEPLLLPRHGAPTETWQAWGREVTEIKRAIRQIDRTCVGLSIINFGRHRDGTLRLLECGSLTPPRPSAASVG